MRIDRETGQLHITRTVEVDAIFSALNDYRDILSRNAKNRAVNGRLIGCIDPITAANWRKECGAGVGTKEFAQYAKKKLNDRDYSKFRMDWQH